MSIEEKRTDSSSSRPAAFQRLRELPVIGRAPRHPNLIFAFGHGHIGLSTGPVTGRIVADLADQRSAPLPVEPFAPERFGRL